MSLYFFSFQAKEYSLAFLIYELALSNC